jgi:uncharacterized protein (TIGR00730 family)
MRIYFMASGIECETTRLRGIEVGAVAELVRQRFDTLIFGGSGIGLMGAFADAFIACGGGVVSVRPPWLKAEGLAYEQGEVIDCDDLGERKKLMSEGVDAVLCYPGGVGTWDELFDLIASRSVQPELGCPPIYIYNWEKYYAPLLLQMEVAGEVGLVHRHALASLHPFETVEALGKLILADA